MFFDSDWEIPFNLFVFLSMHSTEQVFLLQATNSSIQFFINFSFKFASNFFVFIIV